MITTAGLTNIAYIIGGSGIAVPNYTAIGTGSSTLNPGNISLDAETDRNQVTSINLMTPKQVLWTADFSSVEISGTNFQEFGLFNSSSGATMFTRYVIGSITFDGETELQIQQTIRFV